MYEVKKGRLELNHGSIEEGLIAIASGKGGVGKSTVTVNLALALHNMEKKVGIIDADVHGFSIPRIIGLKEQPEPVAEKEVIPPRAKGISVISMGSFVNENSPVIWRAPLLAGALEQFFKEIRWGNLDYLLLDLPPGTGDMPLNIMQQLDHAETLIVTTPQITATNVAGRIGKMARKMNSEITGVIENMAYYRCPECGNQDYIFGRGGGEKLAAGLDVDFLGSLPLVTALRSGGDRGEPIVSSHPEAGISGKFKEIARKIDGNNRKFTPVEKTEK